MTGLADAWLSTRWLEPRTTARDARAAAWVVGSGATWLTARDDDTLAVVVSLEQDAVLDEDGG